MTTVQSNLLTALNDRVSVRDFRSEPVDDALLEQVLAAATRAPTSFSLQGYSLVVVRSAGSRAALAELLGKWFVSAAPVFVLVCADVGKLCGIGDRYDVHLRPDYEDLALSAVIDASLAGMCLSLGAESAGLGTVMVGAVRNKAPQISDLLDLPDDVHVLFGVCIGWPDDVPPARPRLKPDLVVHEERYQRVARAAVAMASGESLWKPAGEITDTEVTRWRDEIVRGLRTARRRHDSAR